MIAFVEGVGTAFFMAAYPGSVRSVVPTHQLPDAAAVQTGRNAIVQLAGSPLGGALFTIARVLPFVVDVISYAFSAISLLLMRAKFQEEREHDHSPLRSQLLEGVRYVWHQPFLRTVALIFGLLNFVGPSILFAIVVIGTDQGLSGGEVGLLVAVFFAGILPGTALSPYIRRALPVRAVFVLELWTWVGCAAFLVWPSVYVLAVCLLPTALVIPSTDAVVHGYRIAMTPDRLLGRAESAWTTFAIVISPIGPLITGVLITEVSSRAAIGLCVALGARSRVVGDVQPGNPQCADRRPAGRGFDLRSQSAASVCTMRSLSGCTGRLFSEYAASNASTCSAPTDRGCCIRSQLTPSVHGGVVRLPR